MPRIRYRIRTIMMVIAGVAVFMGLLLLWLQDCTLTLAPFIVLISPLALYWCLSNAKATTLKTSIVHSRSRRKRGV